MKGMKEPLILLFSRDGDFARSVREAVSQTGATALVERRAEDPRHSGVGPGSRHHIIRHGGGLGAVRERTPSRQRLRRQARSGRNLDQGLASAETNLQTLESPL